MSSPRRAVADTARLQIVPMAPSFAAALAQFHDRLSAVTVRNRFFGAHPHLSAAEVARFCDVDHVQREAVVALDGATIVAVARFERLDDDPAVAEVAFVVADAWQGRGVAGVLLDRLTDRARAVGVRRFVALTLPTNRRMRTMFDHSGLPCRQRVVDGLVEVELDVPPAP